MRFFINSHPWSLKNELRCYRVPNEIVVTWRVVLTKDEVKYSKVGGVWTSGILKLKEMMRSWEEKEQYEYAGCLGEQDKRFYKLSFYFYKWHEGRPVEIPLPNKKELRRLGLVYRA